MFHAFGVVLTIGVALALAIILFRVLAKAGMALIGLVTAVLVWGIARFLLHTTNQWFAPLDGWFWFVVLLLGAAVFLLVLVKNRPAAYLFAIAALFSAVFIPGAASANPNRIAPPSNVHDINVTATSFTLVWDASPTSRVDSYVVYGDKGRILSSVVGTKYDATGLTPDKDYSFQVAAQRGNELSAKAKLLKPVHTLSPSSGAPGNPTVANSVNGAYAPPADVSLQNLRPIDEVAPPSNAPNVLPGAGACLPAHIFEAEGTASVQTAASWLNQPGDGQKRLGQIYDFVKAHFAESDFDALTPFNSPSELRDRVSNETVVVKLPYPIYIQNTYCNNVGVHVWENQTLPAGSPVVFVKGWEPGNQAHNGLIKVLFKGTCWNVLLRVTQRPTPSTPGSPPVMTQVPTPTPPGTPGTPPTTTPPGTPTTTPPVTHPPTTPPTQPPTTPPTTPHAKGTQPPPVTAPGGGGPGAGCGTPSCAPDPPRTPGSGGPTGYGTGTTLPQQQAPTTTTPPAETIPTTTPNNGTTPPFGI